VNDYTKDIKEDIKDLVNTLLNEVHLIPFEDHDGPLGLGVNATVTGFPEIIQGKELLSLRKKNIKAMHDHFLNLNNLVYFNGGVRNSFYRVSDPLPIDDLEYKEIEFGSDNYHRDVNVYLTDYSLNTGAYVLQKYLNLSQTLDNDTLPAVFHPFDFDTQYFSKIISEIATAFPENKLMSLTVRFDNENNKQSFIKTSDKGTYAFVAACADLNVMNDNQEYETILSVKLQLEGEAKASVVDSKLVISLAYIKISNFVFVSSKIGNIDLEKAITNLQQEFTRIADYLNKFLFDFDIIDKLNSELAVLSDFRLKDVSITSYEGYNGLAFDFKQ